MSQPARPPQGRLPDAPSPEMLRDSRRAALLLITGVLLGMLPMPWSLVAAVALLPSLYFFVRTLRAQIGTSPAPAVLWTALGFVFASMSLAGTLLPYLFFNHSMALQECVTAANTLQAESECTQDWTSTFNQFTGG
ncbi:hypothetical protein [Kytococcus sp. Marseille-QA3725]